ncbi:Uncharacterised protein [Vibrio mimicus]|uniref:hypothetical protein n=1 Tax=Vibrio mimicus TaxID=674 RepID=UPI0002BA00B7|nr:hypothetical protein [Vibrio mimicus]EMB49457.1 hypothetical protein D908_13713 [Vibrio mimicus CAIM 602]MBY7676522.1 hypothetical protein [Vibrio mimicus]MBY7728335.1 hypothetical protein [Vibrio mimicus]TXY29446.1 hypothetical protein FXE86_14400 [Vibrio mimicus]SUQ23543.1 Uncharacterised protein [Vibrio mimicus]
MKIKTLFISIVVLLTFRLFYVVDTLENIITFSYVWFAGVGMFLITFFRDKSWVVILLGAYSDNPIAIFLYRFFSIMIMIVIQVVISNDKNFP